MNHRTQLKSAKRIVVKVGTSTLFLKNGKPDLYRIEHLIRELSALKNEEREIIFVTSGAIAYGMNEVGIFEKPTDIPKKQALAAIGQSGLMHLYKRFFADYGQTMAQVLLTRENAARHHQYTNSRNALLSLLDYGVIPVINENDVVAIDEIKIGDNDNLSATVAALVDADALLILSDIDGVYTGNPSSDPAARRIEEIMEVTPEIEHMAGGAGSAFGTGGMATKIEAARIAQNAGVMMVIARGSDDEVIRRVFSGERVGTLFPAREAHLRVRQNWLAFGKRMEGTIVVDAGCADAIITGKSSLLAAGIVSVEGDFTAGSSIRILAPSGQEIARGITNYNARDIVRIKGLKSQDFKGVLGEVAKDEVVHRDNLVLLSQGMEESAWH